ncbi:MAG: LysR family transcriptional regulator [Geminicoccaceae bacterium]|nr:MAG: LysR family transcriptional regulator [Geminicoccaceae bacterium]
MGVSGGVDFKQLRYFVAIVDAGSFTRAAARLAVAQPALSRQVRDLEEELGVLLLHRNGRGVVPTEAGRQLTERARRVLAAVEEIKADLHARSDVLTGTVTVAAPPTVANPLGLDLLRAVRAAHPELRLHLVEGMSAHVREWLANGSCDLGVVYEAQTKTLNGAEPLVRERLHLLVPAAWRFAQPGSPVRLQALDRLPLVLSGPAHGLRSLVEAAAERVGLRLRPEVEVDCFGAIRELVIDGKAAAVQPLTAFMRDVRDGHIQAHPIVEPVIERRLMVATPAIRAVSPAVRAVVHLLKAEVQRLAREAAALAGQPDAALDAPLDACANAERA